MKKTKVIIALALVVALAAVGVVGLTLAYLTDSDDAVNTFTVGNVEIELIESKLHRVNAGTDAAGRLSTDEIARDGAAGTAPEDAYGWTGAYFTDDTIKADAADYADYLAEQGDRLVPGRNVMKCPYVINTGNTDAYVRVRVLVPAALDNGIIGSSMYTQTAINNGAVTLAVTADKEVDGIVYNEYAFTYADPIAPDQMTFWNVWGDIRVAPSVTSADIQALIDNGDLDPDDMEFGVLVQADAIQAEGFDTAAAAFAAFDA